MYDELVKKVNVLQTYDPSNLIKKSDYTRKVSEIKKTKTSNHNKYYTTNNFKKC